MNDKATPLPFGGPELLQQARDLCYAIESLPPGTDQTKLSSLVSDAAFALQNFQSTGKHFWPRLVDPVTAMDFGQAIKALKRGERVSRAGWNGKGMFLVYVSGSDVAPYHGTPYHDERIIDGDGRVTINPHIDMKTATGEMQPGWLASQSDMLADDWQVVS